MTNYKKLWKLLIQKLRDKESQEIEALDSYTCEFIADCMEAINFHKNAIKTDKRIWLLYEKGTENITDRNIEKQISELKEKKKTNKKLEKMWKKFSENNPTNDKLRQILSLIISLRKKAGKKLLEQNPTAEDLIIIILYVESLSEEAEKKLFDMFPESPYIKRDIKALRDMRKVWKKGPKMTKRETNEVMKKIIQQKIESNINLSGAKEQLETIKNVGMIE